MLWSSGFEFKAAKPGKEARNLRYLATGTESKVAVDMRQKMQYLTRNNNGRGPILLTATPTPNSPLDIFNMLSHLLGPDELMKYGIANQDDFISMFGETSEVMVSRIDGEMVSARGLTGFTNLPALRALMDKYLNRKNIKDVAADTKVPEIVNEATAFDMTQQQKDAYEFLRLRAEVLSATKSEGAIEIMMGNASPEKLSLIEQILINYPDDQIFSIIRDMDRTAYDIELFNGEMTFIFAKDKTNAAEKALATLGKSKKVAFETFDDNGEKTNVKREILLNAESKQDSDGKFVVTINEHYEEDYLQALIKAKISQADVSHPVSPKYAQLIEKLKEGLENGGKQIIFTEEKSQHRKLHRILSHHLNIKPNEIGILNGDTVSGIASASNADKYKKLSPKAKKDLAAQGVDVDGDGLEAIASKYNSGKFKILICNKKAEVGVNLHIGTTDIHHLTIPWTPASIDQRNGRGARVGAPQEFVKSHNYLAKESFDQFRLDTVNRKRKWQEELISGDKIRADNGDADNENEQQLLLARNPEEMAALLEAQKKEAQAHKLKIEQDAATDLMTRFINAYALSKQKPEQLEREESNAEGVVTSLQRYLATEKSDLKFNQNDLARHIADGLDSNSFTVSKTKTEIKNGEKAIKKYKAELKKAETRLKKAKKGIAKMNKAKKVVMQLTPQIQDALSNTSLNINRSMFERPEDYLVLPGRTIAVGETYFYKRTQDGDKDYESIVRIESINNVDKTVKIQGIDELPKKNNEFVPNKAITDKVEIAQTDVDLIIELRKAYAIQDHVRLVGDFATLTRLIDENLLPSDTYVLTKDSDGNYNISQAAYASRSELVWPDKTSKRFKEEFAHWYINARKTGKFGGWGNQSRFESLLTFVFDTQDFLSVISTYDENSKSEKDINDLVYGVSLSDEITTALDSMVAANEKEGIIKTPYLFERNSRQKIMNDVDSKDLQYDAIKSVAEKRIKFESEKLEASRDSKINAIAARNGQTAFNVISSSDDIVKGRLSGSLTGIESKLPELMYHSSRIEALKGSIAEQYKSDMIILLVDLIKAGYPEPADLNGFALSPHQVTRKLQEVAKSYKDNQALLTTFIGNDDKEASVIEDDEPTIAASVDTSEISFAQELFDKFGVKCKKNTQALSFQTRRGKEYGSAAPFEMVGFYDPNGKTGELAKLMQKLKASSRKDPKAMYPQSFDTSTGFDEFINEESFWWFVRVDDLNLVTDSLL
ncbi:helicase-related protein [Aliivibrio salmonicida]|uniref:helicase-related protein n=1 Tax=Aliivibrio salmonicida TaxID=40269 RepID=UPI003D0D0151